MALGLQGAWEGATDGAPKGHFEGLTQTGVTFVWVNGATSPVLVAGPASEGGGLLYHLILLSGGRAYSGYLSGDYLAWGDGDHWERRTDTWGYYHYQRFSFPGRYILSGGKGNSS